jgi:hypothetical protein
MGQGEHHMKIGHWQEHVFLLDDPHLLVDPLALRTVPVATGVVTDSDKATTITTVDVSA